MTCISDLTIYLSLVRFLQLVGGFPYSPYFKKPNSPSGVKKGSRKTSLRNNCIETVPIFKLNPSFKYPIIFLKNKFLTLWCVAGIIIKISCTIYINLTIFNIFTKCDNNVDILTITMFAYDEVILFGFVSFGIFVYFLSDKLEEILRFIGEYLYLSQNNINNVINRVYFLVVQFSYITCGIAYIFSGPASTNIITRNNKLGGYLTFFCTFCGIPIAISIIITFLISAFVIASFYNTDDLKNIFDNFEEPTSKRYYLKNLRKLNFDENVTSRPNIDTYRILDKYANKLCILNCHQILVNDFFGQVITFILSICIAWSTFFPFLVLYKRDVDINNVILYLTRSSTSIITIILTCNIPEIVIKQVRKLKLI